MHKDTIKEILNNHRSYLASQGEKGLMILNGIINNQYSDEDVHSVCSEIGLNLGRIGVKDTYNEN